MWFLYHDDIWWIFRWRNVESTDIETSKKLLQTYGLSWPWKTLFNVNGTFLESRETLRYGFKRSLTLGVELQEREEILKKYANQISFTEEQKRELMNNWHILNNSLDFYLWLFTENTPAWQSPEVIEKFLREYENNFTYDTNWLLQPERHRDLEAVTQSIKEKRYMNRPNEEDEIPF